MFTFRSLQHQKNILVGKSLGIRRAIQERYEHAVLYRIKSELHENLTKILHQEEQCDTKGPR